MSSIPAMPVFTDALLAATVDLSTVEFGAYLRILIVTWEKGGHPLPDDDRKLARITGCSLRHWRDVIRPAIVQFFDISEGTFHQKRLTKEWVYESQKRAQKVIAGEASAEARRLKSLETSSTAVATGTATAAQRRRNSSTSTSLESKKERISAAAQPRPTDVPDDLGLTTDQSAPVIPLQTPKRPDRSPEMLTIWRSHFELLWPKVTTLPATRVQKFNTRLLDTFGGDLEQWREFCRRAAATPFLVGEGEKGWRASLDWMLQPGNIAKVLDGNYDNLATNRGYGSNVQRSDRRLSPHDAMAAGFARAAGYDIDGTGDR